MKKINNGMPSDTFIKYRLYIIQLKLLKKKMSVELLLLNFNYQDTIFVSTGLLEYGKKEIVYQTYSCGCGPQPTIRGAFLVSKLPWLKSSTRQQLEQDGEISLAKQKVFSSVYRINRPENESEREKIVKALKEHFGEEKKVGFL